MGRRSFQGLQEIKITKNFKSATTANSATPTCIHLLYK